MAVWVVGAWLLVHETSSRHAAQLDLGLQRFEAQVQSTEAALRREAALLAQDAAVVEGARLGDWATVARGAPRLRTLTTERIADLVMVVGPGAVVLAQVPATPAVTLPLLPGIAAPTVRQAQVEREPFVLGVAPIAGNPAAGFVVVGRRASDLAPPGAGDFAVFVIADDMLRHSTLAGAPATGWDAATAVGERSIDGEPWRLPPAGRRGAARGDTASYMGARRRAHRCARPRPRWRMAGRSPPRPAGAVS